MEKLTIDGKEYNYEDLTAEQKAFVNHIADIENKIKSVEFNLEQLKFSHEAFVQGLKKSL